MGSSYNTLLINLLLKPNTFPNPYLKYPFTSINQPIQETSSSTLPVHMINFIYFA